MSVRSPRAGAKRVSPPATAAGEGAERLYSIGELAQELEVTTRAIRFYEAKGLIAPVRRGVHRSYSRRDRARLRLILRGKNLGFKLEEVAQYLKLYDADPSQIAQTRMLLAHIERAIEDLLVKRADIDRTLKELKEIRSQCREHLSRKDIASGGAAKG
jgi:DNA-binding transcriptional MerR regulator